MKREDKNDPTRKILTAVRRTIADYGLFNPGDRVIAACSGGADSTALVSLLLALRDEWDLDLSVAHFNHGLRNTASEDEAFVRGLADTCGLPFLAGRGNVRSHAERERLSLEEAARDLRYEFLKEEARDLQAERIAVGHTLDDQAETVLMRLIRGSGPLGLTGIWPSVEGLIVRPLIRLRRQDILFWLKAGGLDFRTDESNEDRRFFRNKIRLELIPFIRERLGRDIVPSLGRLADILQAEDLWLAPLVESEGSEAILNEEAGPLLRLDVLERLPKGLKRRLVREYIRRLSGRLRSLKLDEVDTVLEMKNGDRVTLSRGIRLRREGISILVDPGEPSVRGFRYDWDGESSLDIPEAGIRCFGRTLKEAPEDLGTGDDRSRIWVDKAALHFPLCVRNRREGDAYRPLGSPGRKKVKEIMRAKGLPLRHRDRVPVFLSSGEIVWIFGLPVAESFKVTEETDEVFVIECREGGGDSLENG